MTPDEVLHHVSEMGISVSRSTLLRFENNGLIPKAKRGSSGRAQGRYSEYPDETPVFFYAAWILIKNRKYSPKELIRGILFTKVAAEKKLLNSHNDTTQTAVELYKFTQRFYHYDNHDERVCKDIKDIWIDLLFDIKNDALSETSNQDDYVKRFKEHINTLQRIMIEWLKAIDDAQQTVANLLKTTDVLRSNLFDVINQAAELQDENEKLRELLKKNGINPA
ncbi:MAG: hypothetical protein ABFC57_03365 [Veillonellales bacterium]